MSPAKAPNNPKNLLTVLALSSSTLLIAITIGVFALNPIWSRLSPPFPILRVHPPITAPVDGPYYIEIAAKGYTWDEAQPLSLWYHPFLPFLISLTPTWFPPNTWFWFVSLVFSFGSLILAYRITAVYADGKYVSPLSLLLTLLVPGGLGIATGNPELPTLFFVSLLLLSVVEWHNLSITLISSFFAILVKPNALYMIPVLLVYGILSIKEKNKKTLIHSLVGISVLITTWFIWISIVGWNANEWDAYWNARNSFSSYVAGNPANYFIELTKSFLYNTNLRDQLRYSVALVIPIVNLWIIASVQGTNSSHRYALVAGNLAMLGMALWQGNPNKIIVYSTTLPGYFSVYFLFIRDLIIRANSENHFWSLIVNIVFGLYILAMIVFYVFGTPLGWYY